ncbi:dynein axonemal assembly factor 1 homolog [Galleria mellonella]|uniref:Dynein axonemal assembly factor 1 homolog n=1 Tax=Galleria mellonella TaxID=7137 RepID=A0A6J3BZV0_GALME|nr:dynein axonemal assembly factor 1 homolog [Galleria mellonella]
MSVSDASVIGSEYIQTKRAELREFFKDANLPKELIDKIIENELKPLMNTKDKPYIEASCPGEVKSEYEVMTGQPFSKVKDSNRPFTTEEIKEMLKNNPIITEKARQIQVMSKSLEHKEIAIPLEHINLPTYKDIRDEINSAKDNKEKVNKINYKNMQALMNSVTGCKNVAFETETRTNDEFENNSSDDDEKEYEEIEKVVSQYTNKCYETRYQETKDMLLKLADKYDNSEETDEMEEKKLKINQDSVLKKSSVHLIKGQIRKSAFEEIKEKYAINEAINIPLKDNPVIPNLSGDVKQQKYEKENNNDEIYDVEKVFPKSFEERLKDTEKALRDINSILNQSEEAHDEDSYSKLKKEKIEETVGDFQKLQVLNNNVDTVNQSAQIFDGKMEETLHNALVDIFEITDNENKDNKQLEFNEMKNLARNIVEGAENLSILFREDITNKLNSMNELLNDVNEALENSKKSNIAYQKIKEQSEIQKSAVAIMKRNTITHEESPVFLEDKQDNNKPEHSTVSNSQIDNINTATEKLNIEIKCHEDRIIESKANYELRNTECKEFIKEVDDILQKSHGILHPTKDSSTEQCMVHDNKKPTQASTVDNNKVTELKDNSKNVRKELWDIDIQYKDDRNKKMAEFKQQELERNKRINDLLFDIKDKMKDNKEVLRLANNLLRREESRKKALNDNTCKIRELPCVETDMRAQGDHVRKDKNKSSNAEAKCIPILEKNITDTVKVDGITKEEKKKKQEEEKEKETQRQREYQKKLEKEMEEINKGPRMTKEFIKNHCRQHKLYCTPHLNDILYLHFKGFAKIENLEEYTGLKCIFLENNGIQRIEGLDTLAELKCLYLHYNVLRKIENLHGCPKLDTLNLDHNFIAKIENLDMVPDLHTLSIAHNMLTSIEDLEHLRTCNNLSVLDISYNRIEDPLIVDILADMAILKVLVLTGNPVVRNIPAYRKTLTLRIKDLQNLDNRPVFPRDRACAEAWQRGGVQEEIAERKRWIARDQEKTMQSVRYLIRMRDEKKAAREAKEKEEREKLELPLKNEDNKTQETINLKEANVTQKIEKLSAVEEKFGPEKVKTNDGVAVDMLTGSEEEDTTSEESSEGDDEKDETATGRIEWSQLDSGKRLIQEIKDEPVHQAEDYWYGYRGNQKPDNSGNDFASEFQAIDNLLFNQTSHTDKKKQTEILGELKCSKSVSEVDSAVAATSNVQKKPMIEIIETKNPIVQDTTDNQSLKKAVIKEEDRIIECGRKIIEDKSKTMDSKVKDKKPLKNVTITEVKSEIVIPTEMLFTNKNGSNNDVNNKKVKDNEYRNEESDRNSSSNVESTSNIQNVQAKEGDDVTFTNYMQQLNPNENDDEDLKPSKEDLEIFAELEREQQERQARIDRGEPVIDPMKLYDKKTMDAFYKAEERRPAHEVKEKTAYTTYNHDNGFDRIALSQLTGGEKPDVTKVKLTHIPGALLYQYVDTQAPSTEVQYEISDEVIESAPSSGDTESINILSDTDTSEEEIELQVKNINKTSYRPSTASIKINKYMKHVANTTQFQNVSNVNKPSTVQLDDNDINVTNNGNNLDTVNRDGNNVSDDNKQDNKNMKDEDPKVLTEDIVTRSLEQDETVFNDLSLPSYSSLMSVDRCEAKKSIIDTINSYQDARYPSQGVNYSDPKQNARVEESVASEILERTLQFEEREMYRQIDVLNSHAGKIDNKTNAIIEHISGHMQNEFTLPEVSRILEVHMEAAEQRWRAGEFVHYVPTSPTESVADENEDTLVMSPHDTSFEDTLTEDNANNKINEDDKLETVNEGEVAMRYNGNDFGICISDESIIDVDKSNTDSKEHETDFGNDCTNISADADDVFEDCVDSEIDKNDRDFERKDETYSLEMKLALGIGDGNCQ